MIHVALAGNCRTCPDWRTTARVASHDAAQAQALKG